MPRYSSLGRRRRDPDEAELEWLERLFDDLVGILFEIILGLWNAIFRR